MGKAAFWNLEDILGVICKFWHERRDDFREIKNITPKMSFIVYITAKIAKIAPKISLIFGKHLSIEVMSKWIISFCFFSEASLVEGDASNLQSKLAQLLSQLLDPQLDHFILHIRHVELQQILLREISQIVAVYGLQSNSCFTD
ncbi:hypothetical protein D3C73_603820 [compost metagenome]